MPDAKVRNNNIGFFEAAGEILGETSPSHGSLKSSYAQQHMGEQKKEYTKKALV